MAEKDFRVKKGLVVDGGDIAVNGDNRSLTFDDGDKIVGDHSSDGLQIRTQDTDPIVFKTNGNNIRMSIEGDGKVGIGTPSPQGNLHVVGATGDAGRIYLSDADNGTGTGDSLLITKSGTNAFIYNRDSGDLRLGSNDTSDYVTIQSDGNVGIGTTSPGKTLHVSDGSTSGITSGTNAALLITDNANPRIYFEDVSEGSGDRVMDIMYENEYLSFNSLNDTASAYDTQNIMVVHRDGNVGIGTSGPDFTLDVTGTFQAQGDHDGNVIIDNTGSAQTILASHTGSATPVPFDIRGASSTNNNDAPYGVLHLTRTNMNADGAGANLHFRTKTFDGSVQEVGGIGATIDTGLTASATRKGSLRFYTTDAGSNRQEKMTIASDGKVGIGTTDPDALLHVDTGSDSGTAIIADGDIIVRRQSDNTNGIRLNAENNVGTHADILFHESAVIAAGNDMYFAIDSDASTTDAFFQWRKDGDQSDTGSPLMTLGESGDLGLGTTSPDGRLHVVDGNHQILTLERTVNNTNYGSGIHFQLGDSASTTAGHNYAAIYGHIEDGTNGSEDGFFSIHTSNGGTLAEKVRVESNGNVGIGITSPSILLDVDGVSGYGGDLDTANTGGATATFVETKGVRLGKDSAGGQSAPIEFMSSHWSSGYGFKVQNVDTSGGTDLIFYSRRGTSTWSEQMRITDDGKVGIGAVDPSEALDVDGSILLAYALGHKGESGQNRIIFTTNTQSFQTGGTNRLVIDQNGDVTISGNLTVSGDTITANVGTLDVEDKNITLNAGGTTATADGAGITIQDAVNSTTDATITWDGTNDEFDFSHSVTITGSLSATTKSFDIEHPTKEGMRLHHGSLEGPEHGVYVRGRLEGDTIELPDYWLGLVDEDTITVQLTPNKGFQQIYVDHIEDNKVYVGTQTDTPIDCFYLIHAERKDVEKMEVEY